MAAASNPKRSSAAKEYRCSVCDKVFDNPETHSHRIEFLNFFYLRPLTLHIQNDYSFEIPYTIEHDLK
jgi:hypothetical protein